MPSTAESILRPIAALVSEVSKEGIEDEVLRVLHEHRFPTHIDAATLTEQLAAQQALIEAQAATIAALTERVTALEAKKTRAPRKKAATSTRKSTAKKSPPKNG